MSGRENGGPRAKKRDKRGIRKNVPENRSRLPRGRGFQEIVNGVGPHSDNVFRIIVVL